MAFSQRLISLFLFVFVFMTAASTAGTENKAKVDAAGAGSAGTGGKASSKKLPQVLDFSAVWCAPCKKFAPVFDKVSETYKGKVEFIHYDIENGPGKAVAEKLKINTVPTVLFMNAAGKTVYKHDRLMKEDELVKHTEELLK